MITGVLLAAGAGTRFGGAKLLAHLPDGRTVAHAAVEPLAAAVDDVVAVVRPGNTSVIAVLEQAGCRVVPCDRSVEGMGASLACGIRATPEASGWVIALADMPCIQTGTIRGVVAAMLRGAQMVAPVYQGRRGHPVGFSRRFAPELMALDGDLGARHILGEYRASLEYLEIDDPGILLDVDTVEDLAALAGGGAPPREGGN